MDEYYESDVKVTSKIFDTEDVDVDRGVAMTFNVTVGKSKKSSENNVYFINGSERPSLKLINGKIYKFVIESNSEHPFYFSKTKKGGEDEVEENALFGPSESKTIVFKYSGPEWEVYYACSLHENMGNKVSLGEKSNSKSGVRKIEAFSVEETPNFISGDFNSNHISVTNYKIKYTKKAPPVKQSKMKKFSTSKNKVVKFDNDKVLNNTFEDLIAETDEESDPEEEEEEEDEESQCETCPSMSETEGEESSEESSFVPSEESSSEESSSERDSGENDSSEDEETVKMMKHQVSKSRKCKK